VANPFYRRQGEDLILYCHLQPGARSDEFAGLHDERIKIRIKAPPVDGKANTHLREFLAKAFGVPLKQVVLEAGETSRQKTLRIIQPAHIPEALGIGQ